MFVLLYTDVDCAYVAVGGLSLKGSVLPFFPASSPDSKCQTNKQPRELLLVFLRVCMNRKCCFHTWGEHEHSFRWRELWVSYSKRSARLRTWEGETQHHTIGEKADVHRIREAPPLMLKGFDNSADGHWPHLGLIMHSPVAAEKNQEWTNFPSNANKKRIKQNIYLWRYSE